jgi:hypothetical protein
MKKCPLDISHRSLRDSLHYIIYSITSVKHVKLIRFVEQKSSSPSSISSKRTIVFNKARLQSYPPCMDTKLSTTTTIILEPLVNLLRQLNNLFLLMRMNKERSSNLLLTSQRKQLMSLSKTNYNSFRNHRKIRG